MTDREKLNAAFRAIRKAGGITVTGKCCQSCSWAEAAAKGATENSTVAIHHRQGVRGAFLTPDTLGDTLHIYHGGDSRMVCEALRAQGLRVEWDGSPHRAIAVLPGNAA